MKSRFIISLCTIIAAIAMIRAAGASTIAFDSAGDSAYNAAAAGAPLVGINGGYGWGGGWVGGGRGVVFFIGSSSTNGSGDPLGSGDINSPRTPTGRAWGLTADDLNGGTVSGPKRPFNGALSQDQTFMADFDTGLVDSRNIGEYDLVLGGSGGSITVAAAPHLSSDYLVGKFGSLGLNGGVIDSGVPLTDQGVHVEFTILNGSQTLVSITSLAPGGLSGSVVTPFTTPATFAEVANLSDPTAGVGPGSDYLYLNNIAITPEPLSSSVVLLCVFTLATRRPARRSARAPVAR